MIDARVREFGGLLFAVACCNLHHLTCLRLGTERRIGGNLRISQLVMHDERLRKLESLPAAFKCVVLRLRDDFRCLSGDLRARCRVDDDGVFDLCAILPADSSDLIASFELRLARADVLRLRELHVVAPCTATIKPDGNITRRTACGLYVRIDRDNVDVFVREYVGRGFFHFLVLVDTRRRLDAEPECRYRRAVFWRDERDDRIDVFPSPSRDARHRAELCHRVADRKHVVCRDVGCRGGGLFRCTARCCFVYFEFCFCRCAGRDSELNVLPRAVLFVDGEDDASVCSRRLHAVECKAVYRVSRTAERRVVDVDSTSHISCHS